MTETNRATLLHLLVERYDDLRRRLARRLGSTELATEILHETYLRLDRGAVENSAVHSPKAYVFRAALNVAADRRRSAAGRRLNDAEVDALRGMADAAIDAERAMAARLEVATLERALDELTPRRRAILIAARVHEESHAEIAARFGISTRMVEKELRSALLHCSQRLEKKLTSRFGSRPPETS